MGVTKSPSQCPQGSGFNADSRFMASTFFCGLLNFSTSRTAQAKGHGPDTSAKELLSTRFKRLTSMFTINSNKSLFDFLLQNQSSSPDKTFIALPQACPHKVSPCSIILSSNIFYCGFSFLFIINVYVRQNLQE